MANSKKIWWLLPSLALLAGLLVVLLLYSVADLSGSFSSKIGLVFTICIILSSSTALWIIRAYPTKVGIVTYAIVGGLASGSIAAWLHGLLLGWMTNSKEQAAYGAWIEHTGGERWILYLALLLVFSVVIAMNRKVSELQQRYALQQDAATLLKEAELFKLRQQLQPHFLYNSLNAISALIITAPDRAGEMISRLADFLRTAVRQGRNELVPVEEELEYLKQYLWIESVRFGDRLHIAWEGAAELESFRMPPFLLQPMMENAIRFGVYGKTEKVVIHVAISKEQGLLRIVITNPYDPGMRASSGTGFGLEGIRRRLWLTYGRQDLLKTDEQQGVYTTSLLIPQ